MVNTATQIKPRVGQGRAGLRRKVEISTPPQPNKPTQMISKTNLHKCKSTTQLQTSLESGSHPDCQTIHKKTGRHHWIWTLIIIQTEENSPYQEYIISETYQRLDKSYFQEPLGLDSLVNTGILIQKLWPKLKTLTKY